MSYLCVKCSEEFEKHEDYTSHKMSGCKKVEPEKQSPVEIEQQPVIQTQTPQPPTLTYVYKGKCPSCSRDINTIELDVEKDHFVLAYCMFCKTQLDSRKVEKLDQGERKQ